jgi:uncharacterized protein (DUF302 family)
MLARESPDRRRIMDIGFEIGLESGYDEAVERVEEALKSEGFGVLTRIDVKNTLREKLGEEFRPYVILGACNPPLAHRALSARPEVGLMLPCNVTVEHTDSGSLVRILDPDLMLGVGGLDDSEEMRAVAAEARERLERVAEKLRS